MVRDTRCRRRFNPSIRTSPGRSKSKPAGSARPSRRRCITRAKPASQPASFSTVFLQRAPIRPTMEGCACWRKQPEPVSAARSILRGRIASTSDFDPRTPSEHHRAVWKGGRWSLADVGAYHRVAIMTVLQYAANNATNFPPPATRRACPASGFVILPIAIQRDPGAAETLVQFLQRGGIASPPAHRVRPWRGRNSDGILCGRFIPAELALGEESAWRSALCHARRSLKSIPV